MKRTSGLLFASFLIVAFSVQGFAQDLSAGNNQRVKAGTVSVPLHGTSGMGPNAQYSWVQLAGPSAARLENGTTLNATAAINGNGTYIFQLTGKDGDTTKSDRVTIQIETEEGEGDDARQSGVTAYLGTAFDNFVASEQRTYLNKNLPEVSGSTDARALFGFDANFRVLGTKGSDRQLWFYLETLHGVRSADVDCGQTENRPAICDGPDTDPAKIGPQAKYILKNASSLEGFGGFRFELLPLQLGSAAPMKFYVKGQLGFMAVAKNPGDVVDNHFIGIGLTSMSGELEGSYFDVGWGRTDLFGKKRLDRWKYDAYVTFKVSQSKGLAWLKPFAQVTVDSDFGGGADSIQSYLGFNFDLKAIWH